MSSVHFGMAVNAVLAKGAKVKWALYTCVWSVCPATGEWPSEGLAQSGSQFFLSLGG